MFRGDKETRPPALLVGTVKIAAVIGGLAYAGATWMANGVDSRGLVQLAGKAGRSFEDPVTTGSLARSAGGVTLDPCAAPGRGVEGGRNR